MSHWLSQWCLNALHTSFHQPCNACCEELFEEFLFRNGNFILKLYRVKLAYLYGNEKSLHVSGYVICVVLIATRCVQIQVWKSNDDMVSGWDGGIWIKRPNMYKLAGFSVLSVSERLLLLKPFYSTASYFGFRLFSHWPSFACARRFFFQAHTLTYQSPQFLPENKWGNTLLNWWNETVVWIYLCIRLCLSYRCWICTM